MTSPATLAPEKPEVRTLPALDSVAVCAGAAAAVDALFSDDMTLVERLQKAHQVQEDLDQRVRKVRAERDAAAWTLHTGYRCRKGASIADALGVGRTRWKSIRDRIKALPVEPAPVADAPNALPRLAARAAVLQAQLDRALEIRKDAAKRLNLPRAEIGRLLDLDPSRVSHLLSKKK